MYRDNMCVVRLLTNGFLDFLVLVELPDSKKIEFLEFPRKDIWGLIIPSNDPLSKKIAIRLDGTQYFS